VSSDRVARELPTIVEDSFTTLVSFPGRTSPRSSLSLQLKCEATLCLASTLLVAACVVKEQEPYDFPVMRLTIPPAADAQGSQFRCLCYKERVVMRFFIGALALAVLIVVVGLPVAVVLGWVPITTTERQMVSSSDKDAPSAWN
jgi:hypothetical protein